jgi:uncharacterized membrane protein YqgA involved in biofilm formation
VATLVPAGDRRPRGGRRPQRGGVTIIGIALKLLDIKDVNVGNFLRALVIAPALVGVVNLP